MGRECLYLEGSKEFTVFNSKPFPDDFSAEIYGFFAKA